jgi:hypothetical protein
MSRWDVIIFILTGAATCTAVLGVFYAVYARRNRRETQEFIDAQHRVTQEFLARVRGEFAGYDNRDSQGAEK